MDYDSIYELLKYERDHGNIIWVMGPACAFDADARSAFAALVREGFVDGILAGNALATHDLEAGYRGTALGQDVYTQRSVPNGHYNHIDTINEVRRLGSIQAFVDSGEVRDGILYECVKKSVPFVLVGSVRDDGPLPEVYGNVYEGQNAMRDLVRKATTIICMASTLHTVATGNMTPCYRVVNGSVRPLYFYSVDISEFAVNKLRDRGSLSVKTIVTNVQDFIVNVRKGVCRRRIKNRWKKGVSNELFVCKERGSRPDQPWSGGSPPLAFIGPSALFQVRGRPARISIKSPGTHVASGAQRPGHGLGGPGSGLIPFHGLVYRPADKAARDSLRDSAWALIISSSPFCVVRLMRSTFSSVDGFIFGLSCHAFLLPEAILK